MSPLPVEAPATAAMPTPLIPASIIQSRSAARSGSSCSTASTLLSNRPKWRGPLVRCCAANTCSRRCGQASHGFGFGLAAREGWGGEGQLRGTAADAHQSYLALLHDQFGVLG